MEMTSGGKGEDRHDTAIWLSPGTRFVVLGSVLARLTSGVRHGDDVSELACARASDARHLILDAEALPIEDVGYVRRFLDDAPDAHATIVGLDAGARVARALLALPRTRWMAWPPDLDTLVSLSGGLGEPTTPASSPRAGAPKGESPTSAAPRSPRAPARRRDAAGGAVRPEDAELAQIQAILEGGSRAGERGDGGGAADPGSSTSASRRGSSSYVARTPVEDDVSEEDLSEEDLEDEFDALERTLDDEDAIDDEDMDLDLESDGDDDDESEADDDASASSPAETDRLRAVPLRPDEPLPDPRSSLAPDPRAPVTPPTTTGLASPDAGPFDAEFEVAFRDQPVDVPAVTSIPPAREEPRDANAPKIDESPTTPVTPKLTPPWWRAQVADLADAAQKLQLSMEALRASGPDDEEVRERVDQLDAEVARIVQFARTLGYLAAPPTRGQQVFDLADTVQLFVAQLASRPGGAPRCQFRALEPVYVRSDRTLIGSAFDAFFWLAGACSQGGDLVRAQVKREGDWAEVRVEFPSGPLAGFDTTAILEPYGVRRILPDLGPNALAAASAIVFGQGGASTLTSFPSGRLGWRILLPIVDAPAR